MADSELELSHCLDEGCGFDVAYSAAELWDSQAIMSKTNGCRRRDLDTPR